MWVVIVRFSPSLFFPSLLTISLFRLEKWENISFWSPLLPQSKTASGPKSNVIDPPKLFTASFVFQRNLDSVETESVQLSRSSVRFHFSEKVESVNSLAASGTCACVSRLERSSGVSRSIRGQRQPAGAGMLLRTLKRLGEVLPRDRYWWRYSTWTTILCCSSRSGRGVCFSSCRWIQPGVKESAHRAAKLSVARAQSYL